MEFCHQLVSVVGQMLIRAVRTWYQGSFAYHIIKYLVGILP